MQLTNNSTAFIEAEQYSNFILLNMHDGLLPETFYRNISDFTHGSTLNIKTVGSVTLQEAAEDQPLVYSPIESEEIEGENPFSSPKSVSPEKEIKDSKNGFNPS